MSITQQLLAEISDGDGGATTLSPSFTTVAGRVTLLTVTSNPTVSDDEPVVTTDSAGRAWSLIQQYLFFDSISSGAGIKVFGTRDGGTGTVLLTFPDLQPAIVGSVSDFPEAIGVRNVGLSALNAAGLVPAPTSPLAPFTSPKNGTFLAASCPTSTRTFSPGAGFTPISHLDDPTHIIRLFTEWRNDNDTTPDCALSGTGTPIYGVIALELIAAGAVSDAPLGDDLIF
jgi:hypothetical protein